MVKKLDLAPLGAGPVAHPIPRLLRDAAVAALSLGLATSVVGDQLFMAALAGIIIGRCGTLCSSNLWLAGCRREC